jgi:hypothetical protein
MGRIPEKEKRILAASGKAFKAPAGDRDDRYVR